MNITYPHIIENSAGEKVKFYEPIKEADGEKLVGEIYVTPGNGPIMHTHFLQEEGMTVIKGRVGYQLRDQPEQFAEEGETVVFKRGVAHRFWNAGDDMLQCEAWVKPANTFAFYITAIFNAQKKSGAAKPELFDAAYLIKRYSSEYDLTDIPRFVKKVIVPITYYTGKLLGKYKHFKDAPEPIKG